MMASIYDVNPVKPQRRTEGVASEISPSPNYGHADDQILTLSQLIG